jgi:hypothetical protein
MCIAITAACVYWAASPSDGAAQESDEAEGFAGRVLTLIEANCQHLHSGSYRASGEWEMLKGSEPREASTDDSLIPDASIASIGWRQRARCELTFFSVFDNSDDLYRIDRTESPERMLTLAAQESLRPREGGRSFHWISTPDYTIQASNRLSSSETRERGVAGGSTPRRFFRPFLDVRSLPLISYSGFGTLDDSHGDWLARMKENREVVEEAREADGIYRVTWRPSGEEAKQFMLTYWFDPEQGLMPVRRQHRWDVPGSEKPSEWSETSWISLNDVWVPESYHVVRYYPDRRESLDLAFEWEFVNDDVDVTEFMREGLQLPAGTRAIKMGRRLPSERR